jgi:RNA recognition motif-containing protein
VDLESITIARLHVGNLSYDTAESDLFELFNGAGKVTNAEIVTHSRTQRSKGFGFISLTSVEDARRAASELHGKSFMGRIITVGSAKGPKPEGRTERSERPESEDAPVEES